MSFGSFYPFIPMIYRGLYPRYDNARFQPSTVFQAQDTNEGSMVRTWSFRLWKVVTFDILQGLVIYTSENYRLEGPFYWRHIWSRRYRCKNPSFLVIYVRFRGGKFVVRNPFFLPGALSSCWRFGGPLKNLSLTTNREQLGSVETWLLGPLGVGILPKPCMI